MTTISITIEENNQVQMLVEWLKNIRFVKNISISEEPKGNAGKIQKMLGSMKSKHLFATIDDPVEYQKQLRNEWAS